MKIIEKNIGFSFGNDKVWLFIALSKDPACAHFALPLNELGRAILSLSVTMFCDKAFPDNEMNKKILDVLEQTVQKGSTLRFLGLNFKLDNYLLYASTKEKNTLSSI